MATFPDFPGRSPGSLPMLHPLPMEADVLLYRGNQPMMKSCISSLGNAASAACISMLNLIRRDIRRSFTPDIALSRLWVLDGASRHP